MNRLNFVLSLLLGIAAIALSPFSGSTTVANSKTCEIVKERRCDFKGNCRDEVKEVCSGLSGQRKPVNPHAAPPRAPAKSLVK